MTPKKELNNLRAAMNEQGRTYEAADALGVRPPKLYNIRSGKTQRLDYELVRDLQAFYGITL